MFLVCSVKQTLIKNKCYWSLVLSLSLVFYDINYTILCVIRREILYFTQYLYACTSFCCSYFKNEELALFYISKHNEMLGFSLNKVKKNILSK